MKKDKMDHGFRCECGHVHYNVVQEIDLSGNPIGPATWLCGRPATPQKEKTMDEKMDEIIEEAISQARELSLRQKQDSADWRQSLRGWIETIKSEIAASEESE